MNPWVVVLLLVAFGISKKREVDTLEDKIGFVARAIRKGLS